MLPKKDAELATHERVRKLITVSKNFTMSPQKIENRKKHRSVNMNFEIITETISVSIIVFAATLP